MTLAPRGEQAGQCRLPRRTRKAPGSCALRLAARSRSARPPPGSARSRVSDAVHPLVRRDGRGQLRDRVDQCHGANLDLGSRQHFERHRSRADPPTIPIGLSARDSWERSSATAAGNNSRFACQPEELIETTPPTSSCRSSAARNAHAKPGRSPSAARPPWPPRCAALPSDARWR